MNENQNASSSTGGSAQGPQGLNQAEGPALRRVCTGVKKDGTACKARPVRGTDKCFGHTPEMLEEAHRASAEVRRKNSADRKQRLTEAKLSTRERLARRLEAEGAAVEERIVRLALSSVDETSIRGLQLWLDRVLGRATQTIDQTSTITDASVGQAILDELRAAFPDAEPDEEPALAEEAEAS